MRAKFVEIRPLFSQIFKEILNDILRSLFENSKNFRRNVAWSIENSKKLTKFRWNEVWKERKSEEFLHKQEETSKNFRNNERNMEISWHAVRETLHRIIQSLRGDMHVLYLFSFYHAYFFCSTVWKFFGTYIHVEIIFTSAKNIILDECDLIWQKIVTFKSDIFVDSNTTKRYSVWVQNHDAHEHRRGCGTHNLVDVIKMDTNKKRWSTFHHVRQHKKASGKRTADCALSILPPPTANLSCGLSISVLGKCFLILKFPKHVGKMWNHPQINRNQTNRLTAWHFVYIYVSDGMVPRLLSSRKCFGCYGHILLN